MFSFIRSTLTSHALVTMALSCVSLALLASTLCGVVPLDFVLPALDWLGLRDVADALRAALPVVVGGVRVGAFIVTPLIVLAWCVEAFRDGEVRPNRLPSRRGALVVLGIALVSADFVTLAWLSAVACAAPTVAALIGRHEAEDVLGVLALRFGDLFASAFAVVLYPLSWMLERK